MLMEVLAVARGSWVPGQAQRDISGSVLVLHGEAVAVAGCECPWLELPWGAQGGAATPPPPLL